MLAKLIAGGETREAAIARAVAALRQFPILGVRTNVAFLIRTLAHPAFRRGDLHTGFVDEHLASLLDMPPAVDDLVLAVANAARSAAAARMDATRAGLAPSAYDPWTSLNGWGR
jgi:acetyl/propionyl-CoA carboxylase alpha subunit